MGNPVVLTHKGVPARPLGITLSGVLGGWLVMVILKSGHNSQSTTFYPDPSHEWAGSGVGSSPRDKSRPSPRREGGVKGGETCLS